MFYIYIDMRHGSLFSGIGGFDLAAEWMGWENVFHCEWNPFGQKVLKHHFPNADSLHDITKTDFTKYANKIDILTRGFPCQPYSSAGKRLGKEDERHLWPEMLRAIREISPSFVVGENVRGLTNWNGGLVFDEVCAELETLGYQVAPCIIPACGVDAPHRRERVWFVAYSDSNARRRRCEESGCQKRETNCDGKSPVYFRADTKSKTRDATDSDCNGFNECDCKYEINPSERGVDAQCDIKQGDVDGVTSNTSGKRCRGWCDESKTYTTKERQICSKKTRNGNRVWCETEGCCSITPNTTSEQSEWVEFREQSKTCREKQIESGGDSGESVVADTECSRRIQRIEDIQSKQSNGERIISTSGEQSSSDTNSLGQESRNSNSIGQLPKTHSIKSLGKPTDWSEFPTQSPVCSGDDGLSTELDGITFSKWRAESVKAYGNAIVPQVAYQIFKAISESVSLPLH